jgi:hypothetical protein
MKIETLLAEIERESVGTISESDYIKWVQRSLNRLYGLHIPTDGKITGAYRTAVRRFNREYLGRDYADVDERTQNQLIFANEGQKSYVMWVIRRLNQLGLGPLPVTETYTPAVVSAIKGFQRRPEVALKPDGFVGPKTELALIKATGMIPPGDVTSKKRPKPPKAPEHRKSRKVIHILRRNCRIEHRDAIHHHIKQSIKSIRLAVRRFRELDSMPEAQRAKAWDQGQERVWFGAYSRGRSRTPFKFVKKTIDRINRILRNPPLSKKPLTIECDYSKGAPTECTYGYGRVNANRDYLRPMDNPPEPAPHKVYIAHCWFRRPNFIKPKEWQILRASTVLHEVAHLAGARRLFNEKLFKSDEKLGEQETKRLASRNAWGARVNAQNYAYYILNQR